jgi:hypothetical protein
LPRAKAVTTDRCFAPGKSRHPPVGERRFSNQTRRVCEPAPVSIPGVRGPDSISPEGVQAANRQETREGEKRPVPSMLIDRSASTCDALGSGASTTALRKIGKLCGVLKENRSGQRCGPGGDPGNVAIGGAGGAVIPRNGSSRPPVGSVRNTRGAKPRPGRPPSPRRDRHSP